MIPFKDISCIRGTGTIHRGYYRKTRNGVTYPQHRLTYIDKFGPIDSQLVIHHECGNKWCVNTAHLKLMTRSEHQTIHANNAAKKYYEGITTCIRGHILDGRNSKQRYCKTCHNEIGKLYRITSEIKQKMHEYYLSKRGIHNVAI